jgi:hypothetical protein
MSTSSLHGETDDQGCDVVGYVFRPIYGTVRLSQVFLSIIDATKEVSQIEFSSAQFSPGCYIRKDTQVGQIWENNSTLSHPEA